MTPASSTASSRALWKRRLFQLVRWGVTLGVGGWLLQKIDLASLGNALARTQLLWTAAAVAAIALGHLLYSEAAGLLLRTTGANVPRPRLIANHFLGLFFSLFLPSGVGGDVVRVIDLGKSSADVSIPAAGSMILIQRILALIAALELIVIAMPLAAPPVAMSAAWICGGILAAFLLGAFALAIGPRNRSGEPIPGTQKPLGRALGYTRNLLQSPDGRRSLLLASVLVLLSQSLLVIGPYFVGRSLGLATAPLHYFYIAPLAAIAVTAPVSINGIGIREAIYIHYLGLVGVSNADAAAVGIELFLLNTLFAALGGLAWLFPAAGPTADAVSPTTGPAVAPVVSDELVGVK